MLTFEDDGVAAENLELIHFGLGHLDDRVVVLLRVFDLQLVRGLLAIHDRSRVVFLSAQANQPSQLAAPRARRAGNRALLV